MANYKIEGNKIEIFFSDIIDVSKIDPISLNNDISFFIKNFEEEYNLCIPVDHSFIKKNLSDIFSYIKKEVYDNIDYENIAVSFEKCKVKIIKLSGYDIYNISTNRINGKGYLEIYSIETGKKQSSISFNEFSILKNVYLEDANFLSNLQLKLNHDFKKELREFKINNILN